MIIFVVHSSLSLNCFSIHADVIGHVVEKGDLKENQKDGNVTKLINIVLEDLEYFSFIYVSCVCV